MNTASSLPCRDFSSIPSPLKKGWLTGSGQRQEIKAEAMAAYARQAKDQELILWATEIKVRAERRAGEMLRDSAARGERARGDGTVNQHNRASRPDTPTLAEIGVTPMQSSRWQALASMSQDHFEAAVATAKESAAVDRQADRPDRALQVGFRAHGLAEHLSAALSRQGRRS